MSKRVVVIVLLVVLLLVLVGSVMAGSTHKLNILPGDSVYVYCPEGRVLGVTEFDRVAVFCVSGDIR